MKTALKVIGIVLGISLLVVVLSWFIWKSRQPAAAATATPAPAVVAASETPVPGATAVPDYVLGSWQGKPLTEAELQERLKKAGWTGLADFVVQDVEGYGHVARIIVGPTAPADALKAEFSATLWFVYGIVGSGKETGYRAPQTGLNLLRIELYEVGNFLPQDPTTRPAP